MKIDNQGRTVVPVPANPRSGSVGGNTQPAELSVPQDQVELSTASQLAGLHASLDEVSVTDAGKVQNIKDAISQGKFQVNAEAVADNLIDSVKELLSHRAR